MQRLPTVILLFLASALFAAEAIPTGVREVLEVALARERDAAARYERYAAKAEEEGYKGAASLFRAQMTAEKTHAERFAQILRAHGLPVPEAKPSTFEVAGTEENLAAAAQAEAIERDDIYRTAVETCNRLGATDIAKAFDQTRDSEVEHANLCRSAARDMASLRESRSYHVCAKCGYTTDVKLPVCPVCQQKSLRLVD